MPRISITHHAAQRYVERHDPALTIDEAHALLAAATEQASRMRARTFKGQMQYLCADPHVVLVVKWCRREGLVCVTVLPGEGEQEQEQEQSDWLSESLMRLAKREGGRAANEGNKS
jgi:hypothetical protein